MHMLRLRGGCVSGKHMHQEETFACSSGAPQTWHPSTGQRRGSSMLYSAEPCPAPLFWLALRSYLPTLPLASRPTSGFQRSEFNMAQALSFAVAARPVSAARLQVRKAEATAAAVSHQAWEPFLPLPASCSRRV